MYLLALRGGVESVQVVEIEPSATAHKAQGKRLEHVGEHLLEGGIGASVVAPVVGIHGYGVYLHHLSLLTLE